MFSADYHKQRKINFHPKIALLQNTWKIYKFGDERKVSWSRKWIVSDMSVCAKSPVGKATFKKTLKDIEDIF